MPGYVFRRVLVAVIAFFIISLIIFWVVHLSGDETVFLPSYIDMGAVERNRQVYDWSDPLIINYARWMGNIFRGDLGESLMNASYYAK